MRFNKNELLCLLNSEKGINPKSIVDMDVSDVEKRCCENILGFKPTPLGISHKPLQINDKKFYIPVATTEGCLVASMCRGIKLLNECNLRGYSENIGISRSFTHEFESFDKAMEFYKWIKKDGNVEKLKEVGGRNSRFCVIREISSKFVVGRQVFIKVMAYTGDAMGMNMITKACEQISEEIGALFGSRLVSLSSNACTDKKHSGENVVNGRGRRVFMSVKISDEVCKKILKVGINQIKKVYDNKMLGSKLVCAGFNCQAANYVAGMFLALNQDLGQIIESSNATLELEVEGEELYASLFMPSVVVGTVGGGTHLEPAASFLKQFDCRDEHCLGYPEDNSRTGGYLSMAVAGAVMAGELSLLAALADNTLMKAHQSLNRAK